MENKQTEKSKPMLTEDEAEVVGTALGTGTGYALAKATGQDEGTAILAGIVGGALSWLGSRIMRSDDDNE